MLSTIFSALFFIAFVALGIFIFVFVDKESKKPIHYAILVFLFVFFVTLSAFKIVPSGSSGVVSTFGNVSDNVLDSGLNFKVPFIQKVVIINNQVQREDVEGNAASKDLQTVNYNVSLNYSIIGSESANLYRTVGKDWVDTIIRPAVQENVKSVIAQYTAEELVTRRSDVSLAMQNALTDYLDEYGISVANINILNMSFSPEFDAAIEAKTIAEQQVLTEKQNLEKAKVIAETKAVEAQGEADANSIKDSSITDKILTEKFLEKWDGKLPVVSGSDNTMLDVSELLP